MIPLSSPISSPLYLICVCFFFLSEVFLKTLHMIATFLPKSLKVKVKSLSHVQLFATLWTVCSLPGFSVHGILQARILEWVTISFSRGSSRPRVSRIGGRRFNLWATREADKLKCIFKSRDITLSTKVCIVKATVFSVATYGCES